MAQFESDQNILNIQRYILIVVIATLAVSIILGYVKPLYEDYFSYAAVVLLIIAAPIRIIAVAKYFKKKGNRRYQMLSYTVILIIILTALVRAIL